MKFPSLEFRLKLMKSNGWLMSQTYTKFGNVEVAYFLVEGVKNDAQSDLFGGCLSTKLEVCSREVGRC